MAPTASRALAVLVAALLSLAAREALAQAAGTIEFAVGDVRVRNSAGVERAAPKGTVVQVGESVVTGGQGQAQMRMVDNAFIAVRPETEINVSDYRFTGKSDGTENAILRLVRGTLRAFTGQIAQTRRDRFVTITPTATIGVRGTGNVAHYSPNLGTLNHTIQGSHEIRSVGTGGQQIGNVVVTTPGQTVQVQINQPPVRIPTPPFLLQAAAVPPAPSGQKPAPGGGQGQGQAQGGGQAASSQTSTDTQSPTTTRTASTVDSAVVTDSTGAALTAATTTVATAPTPVTTTVTGTTSGATLNLTTATATTPTGTTTSLTSGGSFGTPQVFGPGVEAAFFASLSSINSNGSSFAQPFTTSQAFPQTRDYDAFTTVTSFDGAGRFLAAKKVIDVNPESTTVSGDLSGASTVTTLGNGITFGRYSGRNLSGTGPALQVTENFSHSFFNSSTGTFQSSTGTQVYDIEGVLHWIQGPALSPFPSTGPFTGNVTFSSFSGTAPTDVNGTAGTLNSASLFVNFDRQLVNTAVDATVAGNHFVGTANGLALQFEHFSATTTSSGAGGVGRTLSLTMNGTPIGPSSSPIFGFGQIDGRLTGSLVSGATLSYSFAASQISGTTSQIVGSAAGVVGFSAPSFTSTPSASAPYQLLLEARGTVFGRDPSTGALSTVAAAQTRPDDYLTYNAITIENPARLSFNGQGGLTQFDTTGVAADANGTSDVPTRVSTVAAGTSASGAIPAMPAISGTPAALVADSFFRDPTSGVTTTGLAVGKDPVTGITWGRYDASNFAIVNRLNGSTVSNAAGLGNINHYLLMPSQTGATTLPTSGIVPYTWVGGTSPTDNLGNVGVVNSALLTANFSAQTVDASVSATVASRTFNASASAVPIISGVAFEANKGIAATGGTLSVTCSGCSSTQTAGRISGAFAGSTGQGAGFAYSLNAGGLPGNGGVTVGGVAAFRR